jgi:cation diffusion facilitator CzcD-associated flavoprotein CzcO
MESAKRPASSARTPAVPVKDLPGSLPTIPVPEDVDPIGIAETCLDRLQELTAEDLCTDLEAFWRDILILTATFRTFCGSDHIVAAWTELTQSQKAANFQLVPHSARVVRAGRTSWVQAAFNFECVTPSLRTGSGFLKAIPDEAGNWKIWNISTILEQVPEFGDVDFLYPSAEIPSPVNNKNGYMNGDKTRHYDAIIVGAGMAGLSMCGRLQALGVSYVAFESYEEIGGNWTERYESFKLHTSRASSQMPFETTWPADEYPYFLSGKQLAEGYQRHAKKYGLNVQTSSRVKKAAWNEQGMEWTVFVESKNGVKIVKARHLVLATGPGGSVPKMPVLSGRAEFEGQVLHSVNYRTAKAWRGKRGIIIGSANTAHDVAGDMLKAGLESVTMVQRGITPVMRIPYYRHALDPVYNDEMPTGQADRFWLTATPAPITRHLILQLMTHLSSQDSEFFDGLDRVGFKNERVCDLTHILFERLGGHYLDVGASEKVSQGLIKIKSDAPLTGFNKHGLEFGDGSSLDADVVIFATGFESNIRVMAKDILEDDVLDKMDDFYQFDAEGEVIGAWKPMKQPNIWYAAAADLTKARFFSRFLALEIKADLEGEAFRPYLKHRP